MGQILYFCTEGCFNWVLSIEQRREVSHFIVHQKGRKFILFYKKMQFNFAKINPFDDSKSLLIGKVADVSRDPSLSFLIHYSWYLGFLIKINNVVPPTWSSSGTSSCFASSSNTSSSTWRGCFVACSCSGLCALATSCWASTPTSPRSPLARHWNKRKDIRWYEYVHM